MPIVLGYVSIARQVLSMIAHGAEAPMMLPNAGGAPSGVRGEA